MRWFDALGRSRRVIALPPVRPSVPPSRGCKAAWVVIDGNSLESAVCTQVEPFPGGFVFGTFAPSWSLPPPPPMRHTIPLSCPPAGLPPAVRSETPVRGPAKGLT